MRITVGGMASKGLWAISYQGTQKVEAEYKPSHTSEPTEGSSAQLNPYWLYRLLATGHY